MARTKSIRVLVAGDGGWGTAVALLLTSGGHKVRIWGPFPDQVREIEKVRENRLFLRGVKIPHSVEFETDPELAIADADLVVSAIPTQYVRKTFLRFRGLIGNRPVVSLSKGIEIGTFKRPSEILAESAGARRVAALSGPSHAEEVARGLPTSVTVASVSSETARFARDVFMGPSFRVYTSRDIMGVELAGALKNVIAIAAGICDGIGFRNIPPLRREA